jgi:hypothetical protein
MPWTFGCALEFNSLFLLLLITFALGFKGNLYGSEDEN